MFSSICKSFIRPLRRQFSTKEELYLEASEGTRVLVLNRFEGRNSFSRALIGKVKVDFNDVNMM